MSRRGDICAASGCTGAAYLLRWSQAPVTQIGLDAGVATAAGLNKAFARVYGCGPQEFRDRQDTAPYLRRLDKPIADRASATDVYESIRLGVRLTEASARRIAFHRYIGPIEGMASAWSEFVLWVRRNGLLNEDAVLLGVYHDYWTRVPATPTDTTTPLSWYQITSLSKGT